MHLKLKRTPGIYLAGFMGTGKSTIGRLLSDRLGWDFVDLDAEIESAMNRTISQIFDTLGEAEFRRIEHETLCSRIKRVERGIPHVLALGGGAFVQPDNFDQIISHGISVWIDCPFEVIEARLAAGPPDRPNARDPRRLRELFDSRRPLYSKADFTIDGTLEPEAAVEAIIALPLWK